MSGIGGIMVELSKEVDFFPIIILNLFGEYHPLNSNLCMLVQHIVRVVN